MKIKKIIDFCKQSKQIYLYHGEGSQWISDGFSVYPLKNLPLFDEENIFQTFDINDKQKNKINFKTYLNLPEKLDFSDWCDYELPLDRLDIQIYYAGRTLIPFSSSIGIVFMDAKYLVPLSDSEESMMRVFERHKEDGEIYFAVKSGLVLMALVMPFDVINKQFVDRLTELTQKCFLTLKGKSEAGEEIQEHLIGTDG